MALIPQQQQTPPPTTTSSSTIIDLNVGGVHYSTSLATLIKLPNSKLAKSVLKLFNMEPPDQQLDSTNTTSNNSTFPSSSSTSSTSITTLTTAASEATASKKIFIDRDGVLFRFILDFLRQKSTDHFKLPEHFAETERLACEADYYGLTELVLQLRNKNKSSLASKFLEAGDENESLSMLWQQQQQDLVSGSQQQLLQQLSNSKASDANALLNNNNNVNNGNFEMAILPNSPVSLSSMSLLQQQQQQQVYSIESGCITLGYRGTFAFGRDGGMADVKFRKLLRILVAGRVQLCKEVFGDTLNESRDPDRGCSDRYTSRFFLKHVFLEQAFEMLYDAGFKMVGSCGSGTNSVGDSKPGMDSEESKWLHYNEFVFMRC